MKDFGIVLSRSTQLFLTLLGVGTLSCWLAVPALGSDLCLITGKVYVQRKDFLKASWYLDCARLRQPSDPRIYSLLGYSRFQLDQYTAAAGALELGLRWSSKDSRENEKTIAEIRSNRQAMGASLYNQGLVALSVSGPPQGAVPPSAPQALLYRAGPYAGTFDPVVAVTDTIDFTDFDYPSPLAKAAFCFEVATYFMPDAPEPYNRLSDVLYEMGRLDEAVSAAERGLSVSPGNPNLEKSLRAARAALKIHEEGPLEPKVVAPSTSDSSVASSDVEALRRRFGGFVSSEGYGKTHWGQSRKAVRTLYPSVEFTSDSTLFLQDQIVGSPATIWFQFVGNKLVSATIRLKVEHVNKSLYISDYQRLQQRLREKYGAPTQDQVQWLNSLYKNDPEQYGMAVSAGHLRLSTTWETPKTQIVLACTGENFEVFVLIRYTSRELEELQNKAELLRDLEKL